MSHDNISSNICYTYDSNNHEDNEVVAVIIIMMSLSVSNLHA